MVKKSGKKKTPLHIKLLRSSALVLAGLLSLPLTINFIPGRDLSPTEETLVRTIFNDAIDLDKVKIHSSSFMSFMGDQHRAHAFAFWNVVFKNTHHSDPHCSDIHATYTKVHELTHIW